MVKERVELSCFPPSPWPLPRGQKGLSVQSAGRLPKRSNVMNTHRSTASFVTVLVTAFGIILYGFPSLASAKPIVVTTLTDTADPPFNADGPCGTGTLSTL